MTYSDEERWMQFDLYHLGKSLLEEEVISLEQKLSASQSEANIRISLLGYCSDKDTEKATQILIWFIEHDPYSLGLTVGIRNILLSDEQCQRLKLCWLSRIENAQLEAYAYANAAELFIKMKDTKLAKLMLTKAARLEPGNITWERRLAEIR